MREVHRDSETDGEKVIGAIRHVNRYGYLMALERGGAEKEGGRERKR